MALKTNFAVCVYRILTAFNILSHSQKLSIGMSWGVEGSSPAISAAQLLNVGCCSMQKGPVQTNESQASVIGHFLSVLPPPPLLTLASATTSLCVHAQSLKQPDGHPKVSDVSSNIVNFNDIVVCNFE